MPRYDLYRTNAVDEVIDHSVFVSLSDEAAVGIARTVAMVGGGVEMWRDGVRIDLDGERD